MSLFTELLLELEFHRTQNQQKLYLNFNRVLNIHIMWLSFEYNWVSQTSSILKPKIYFEDYFL